MVDMVANVGRPPMEVYFGENTGEALRSAQLAQSAAAAALAAAGVGEYASTALGLAGTAIGETFWVDQGNGTGNIYRHDSGPVATELRSFIIDQQGPGAAALTGEAGGTNVQNVLDTGIVPATAKYGALTPGATAATTVADAFDAVGRGGVLGSLVETDVGSAPIENPGVDILGNKGIYFNTGAGGRRLLNRPGREASRLEWGRENLFRFYEGLRTGAALKAATVGDSNSDDLVGLAIEGYLDALPNVSTSDFSEPGSTIEQFRTGTGPYASNGKSLAALIAYAPQKINMCWGTNDPNFSRNADDFKASLDAVMATIRAALPVEVCSVTLYTPNAMRTDDGQDELWSLQIRPIILAAAERHQCAFFDKNGHFPNSVVDVAAGAMQNKWLDSAGVHTTALSTPVIAAAIAEWLIPPGVWSKVWDNIPTKAAADTAATYPPGVSLARMADGFFNGFVATVNPLSTAGHFPVQIGWAFGGTDVRLAYRIALGGIFSAWQPIGPEPVITTILTSVASGYVFPGATAERMSTQRTGTMVSLAGYLERSPVGQVLVDTTIGTIPTAAHRPIYNIQGAEIVVRNAAGAVERLRADILTTGDVIVRATSAMTNATRVTINESYRGA